MICCWFGELHNEKHLDAKQQNESLLLFKLWLLLGATEPLEVIKLFSSRVQSIISLIKFR